MAKENKLASYDAPDEPFCHECGKYGGNCNATHDFIGLLKVRSFGRCPASHSPAVSSRFHILSTISIVRFHETLETLVTAITG
jgi:hypothetical protein